MRGGRREHISTMERLAHIFAHIARIRNLKGIDVVGKRNTTWFVRPNAIGQRGRQHPIIRSYKDSLASLEYNWTPVTTNARIDDRQMNGPCREAWPRRLREKRRLQDLLRKYIVADIDDTRPWIDTYDNALDLGDLRV